ncbi:MAG TPA: hypothetical protein VHN59_13190 [Chitinophagaceae bacterium]|nr:hypothetical protein [Chitinophagaceae bacterium]
MAEQKGLHIIHSLRQNWLRNYLMASLLYVLAISIAIVTAGHLAFHWPWWIIAPLFIVLAILVYWVKPFRKISPLDISSFLNHAYPQLEESSQLLLLPAESLPLLQQLQQQKLERSIQTIPVPAAMHRPLKKASIFLGAAIVICILVTLLKPLLQHTGDTQVTGTNAETPVKETILAGISQFNVQVIPPAYTRRGKRQQEQFTLKVEEGSVVTWEIKANRKVAALQLAFNNREHISLKPVSADSTIWSLQRTIKEPGFYQVELEGNSSPLYTLEVIHDQPATINIITPQQYTTIEPGRKAITSLQARIADDYGIKDASIIATKASGKGESVSFREQQLNFPVRFNEQKEMLLTRQLDLASMGLQGGDELYFYIKATDNHGQESRSDMYFISLPDTSELLSMSGMEAGVDQFPEYFRSQRQIIMDTEKLLKEQSGISKDSFNSRSNQLGIDQKLLRLRYGKFLGEESESGGHSPDDGHDHGGEFEYGDVQSMIDQYTHKHDNAEDATFFEPEQKAQLKAILTEMWNSELKLRTFIPAEALPYEYKALRLLKDLQQKSRAYVGKTSIKMPPLKPEKRLTGNLEKIIPSNEPSKNQTGDELQANLRKAVAALEQLRQRKQLAIEDQLLLSVAEKAISEKAIQQPGEFLPALSAVRAIGQAPAAAAKQDIVKAQAALQKILATTTSLPQKKNERVGGLAKYYFKNLSE